MENSIKTVFFLTLLSGLLLAIGYLLGGAQGMFLGFLFSLGTNFVAYWFSDQIVLAMHHATPIERGDSRGLYVMVERLTKRAQLPMPKVYLIPDHSPNAFATGRNPENAAVAVTQGLLAVLNDEEVEGVLAHEIAHVKNRDTLISTIAATMASAIMMVANMAKWAALFGGGRRSDSEESDSNPLALIAMVIVAPIAASMIQFAISRSREFLADETGARLTRNPRWLASALQKIHMASGRVVADTARVEAAHMYIMNPFSGSQILELFSTHPPVEERVERLLKLERA